MKAAKATRYGRGTTTAKPPQVHASGPQRPRDNKRMADYEHYKAIGMLWRYFQLYPEG